MSDPLVEEAKKLLADGESRLGKSPSADVDRTILANLVSLVEHAVRERDAAIEGGNNDRVRCTLETTKRLDREHERNAALTRAEKAEAELKRERENTSGYACWFGDCRSRPASMCGVCDAWFCDAHFDHGSPGDGPHQGGRC